MSLQVRERTFSYLYQQINFFIRTLSLLLLFDNFQFLKINNFNE